MRVTLEETFSSLSGHDSATTRFVIGLFRTSPEMKQAISALDRHSFVDEDFVQVINQNKISADDAVNGQIKQLAKILPSLGLPSQKAGVYADKLKQGYTLLVVRTEVERAAEASNLMRQANAEDVSSTGSGVWEKLK